MIPKPLNDIVWADLEALRDSGREEDDTIEYKSSFSGGSDFLAFSDGQKNKAVDAIAKEVIAFLNGRGGDIIIGVYEAKNDHPKIEQFTPIKNVAATCDRLAQSLAALVEPSQTALSLKALRVNDIDADGVIIVRAASSLRAPHRSRRTNICYARRGRESVEMPMDEVQDLTIRRSELRKERSEFLDLQFADFTDDRVGSSLLSAHRFHVRSVYIPLLEQQIEIDDQVRAILRGDDPHLTKGDRIEQIDVPFRKLGFNWRPMLRGSRLANLTNGAWEENDFFYCSKSIKSSGTLMTEFACRVSFQKPVVPQCGFWFEWIAGYMANTLSSFASVSSLHPSLTQGTMRIGLHCAGSIGVATGESYFEKVQTWPTDTLFLPDFPISGGSSFHSILEQVQIDAASLIGMNLPNPYRYPVTA